MDPSTASYLAKASTSDGVIAWGVASWIMELLVASLIYNLHQAIASPRIQRMHAWRDADLHWLAITFITAAIALLAYDQRHQRDACEAMLAWGPWCAFLVASTVIAAFVAPSRHVG